MHLKLVWGRTDDDCCDLKLTETVQESGMIKVENIRGRSLFVGAEDDALWDTAKYIRRMVQRLETHPHTYI